MSVYLCSYVNCDIRQYVGKADFLVFRAMNPHGFLGQLQEKKLVIIYKFLFLPSLRFRVVLLITSTILTWTLIAWYLPYASAPKELWNSGVVLWASQLNNLIQAGIELIIKLVTVSHKILSCMTFSAVLQSFCKRLFKIQLT